MNAVIPNRIMALMFAAYIAAVFSTPFAAFKSLVLYAFVLLVLILICGMPLKEMIPRCLGVTWKFAVFTSFLVLFPGLKVCGLSWNGININLTAQGIWIWVNLTFKLLLVLVFGCLYSRHFFMAYCCSIAGKAELSAVTPDNKRSILLKFALYAVEKIYGGCFSEEKRQGEIFPIRQTINKNYIFMLLIFAVLLIVIRFSAV